MTRHRYAESGHGPAPQLLNVLVTNSHSAIHDLIADEKELGRRYNTKELLLEYPEIGKYVRWKRRKK
jgi:hypothetical protein